MRTWHFAAMTKDRRSVAPVDEQARRLEGQSKFMTYVLRHRPEKLGLALGEGGWVSVSTLIEAIAQRGEPIELETVLQIVRTCNKTRFSISEDGTLIRANQGHSRALGVNLSLPKATPPVRLWHGTKDRFLQEIRRKGLLPMSRAHVHLSPDRATAAAVGDRRAGSTVILEVDAAAMLRDGHAFWVSANGVWLVERVPPACLTFPPAT